MDDAARKINCVEYFNYFPFELTSTAKIDDSNYSQVVDDVLDVDVVVTVVVVLVVDASVKKIKFSFFKVVLLIMEAIKDSQKAPYYAIISIWTCNKIRFPRE